MGRVGRVGPKGLSSFPAAVDVQLEVLQRFYRGGGDRVEEIDGDRIDSATAGVDTVGVAWDTPWVAVCAGQGELDLDLLEQQLGKGGSKARGAPDDTMSRSCTEKSPSGGVVRGRHKGIGVDLSAAGLVEPLERIHKTLGDKDIKRLILNGVRNSDTDGMSLNWGDDLSLRRLVTGEVLESWYGCESGSRWMHVAKGTCYIGLAPPLKQNIAKSRRSDDNSRKKRMLMDDTWNGFLVGRIQTGQSLFVPAGWMSVLIAIEPAALLCETHMIAEGIKYDIRVIKALQDECNGRSLESIKVMWLYGKMCGEALLKCIDKLEPTNHSKLYSSLKSKTNLLNSHMEALWLESESHILGSGLLGHCSDLGPNARDPFGYETSKSIEKKESTNVLRQESDTVAGSDEDEDEVNKVSPFSFKVGGGFVPANGLPKLKIRLTKKVNIPDSISKAGSTPTKIKLRISSKAEAKQTMREDYSAMASMEGSKLGLILRSKALIAEMTASFAIEVLGMLYSFLAPLQSRLYWLEQNHHGFPVASTLSTIRCALEELGLLKQNIESNYVEDCTMVSKTPGQFDSANAANLHMIEEQGETPTAGMADMVLHPFADWYEHPKNDTAPESASKRRPRPLAAQTSTKKSKNSTVKQRLAKKLRISA